VSSFLLAGLSIDRSSDLFVRRVLSSSFVKKLPWVSYDTIYLTPLAFFRTRPFIPCPSLSALHLTSPFDKPRMTWVRHSPTYSLMVLFVNTGLRVNLTSKAPCRHDTPLAGGLRHMSFKPLVGSQDVGLILLLGSAFSVVSRATDLPLSNTSPPYGVCRAHTNTIRFFVFLFPNR